MTDTLTNIPLPSNVWVDLYTQSGITIGVKLLVENIGNADIYVTSQAAQPSVGHDAYNVVKRNGLQVENHTGDLGAWAFSPNADGLANVEEAQ